MKHQVFILEEKYLITSDVHPLIEIKYGIENYVNKLGLGDKFNYKIPYFLENNMDDLEDPKNNIIINLFTEERVLTSNEAFISHSNGSYFLVSQNFIQEKSDLFKSSVFTSVIDFETEDYKSFKIVAVSKFGQEVDINKGGLNFSSPREVFEFLVVNPPEQKKVDISKFIEHPEKFDEIFNEAIEHNIGALIELLVERMHESLFPLHTLPIRLVCEIQEACNEPPSGEMYESYVNHLMSHQDYFDQMAHLPTHTELPASHYEQFLLNNIKSRNMQKCMETVVVEKNLFETRKPRLSF